MNTINQWLTDRSLHKEAMSELGSLSEGDPFAGAPGMASELEKEREWKRNFQQRLQKARAPYDARADRLNEEAQRVEEDARRVRNMTLDQYLNRSRAPGPATTAPQPQNRANMARASSKDLGQYAPRSALPQSRPQTTASSGGNMDFEKQRRQFQRQLGQMDLPEDKSMNAFGKVGDQLSTMYGGQTFTGSTLDDLTSQIGQYDWPGKAESAAQNSAFPNMAGGGGAGSWAAQITPGQAPAAGVSGGAAPPPGSAGAARARNMEAMGQGGGGGQDNSVEIQSIQSQIAQLQQRLQQLQGGG